MTGVAIQPAIQRSLTACLTVMAVSGYRSVAFAQDRSIKVVSANIRMESIELDRRGPPVEAQLRELRLTVRDRSGKTSPASVYVAYEPKSGLLWWKYELGSNLERSAKERMREYRARTKFVLADDKIVGFAMSGFQISVIESSYTVGEIQEGINRIVAGVEEHLSSDRLRDLMSPTSTIDTVSLLGRDFYRPGEPVAMFAPTRIENVAWDGATWTITLMSPNKAKSRKEHEHRDAAVLSLSQRFAPRDAMINGKSVMRK